MSNEGNQTFNLNEMEKDVIGEVMNISMGAAATAMSTILDKKVSITTPRIETLLIEEFEFSYLEPVIGVLIKYIEGISGTNILLMREEDFKKILGHLLSVDPTEMTEFDERSVSAICEIMNQMMGSAASALASFLGQTINISPPEIVDLSKKERVKSLFSLTGGSLVSIKFNISIEGLFESEFISAMDTVLAREIVQMSIGANEVGGVNEVEVVNEVEGINEIKKESEIGNLIENLIEEEKVRRIDIPEPQGRQQVEAKEYNYKPLSPERQPESNYAENNLELIMSVPIEITVELGKTRKKIKDIAELTIGNIVELDRQAGDQVDVVANGRLIAKGDVVVVDDNYSVRITEIIKAKDISNELK